MLGGDFELSFSVRRRFKYILDAPGNPDTHNLSTYGSQHGTCILFPRNSPRSGVVRNLKKNDKRTTFPEYGCFGYIF